MSSSAATIPPKPGKLLPEHARVRLRHPRPASNLPAGAVGTIVHIYKGGAAYEVEFTEGQNAPALETLLPTDVEALTTNCMDQRTEPSPRQSRTAECACPATSRHAFIRDRPAA